MSSALPPQAKVASLAFAFERGGEQKDRWLVADPVGKLGLRARLPGAFSYDRAAESMARSRRAGVSTADLLPMALAASWFVNNPVPSTVFARWLTPPLQGYWRTLIPQLEVDFPNTEDPTAAERAAASLKGLAVDGHGAGAISKVLALLVPKNVPLMPDAALWFALGTVAHPSVPDAQTAGPDAFFPMLDWFTRTVALHESTLAAIAAEDQRARSKVADLYLPSQVLDRLMWFESVGYRNYRKGKLLEQGAFAWVRRSRGDASEQAVVFASAPREALPYETPDQPIDLDAEPSGPWKDQASKALDLASGL